MSIDLKQLKYFAVAEERACRAPNGCTSAAVPADHEARERTRCGRSRTTRTSELTVAGKALMAEASELLAKMRMTIDTIRQIDRGEVGRLRVGIVGSAMWGPIPSLLEQFQTTYPRVTWTLHELGPNVQYEALRAKQIDVGFWREPRINEDELKHDNLRQDLCFRENVCVAVNEHNPLASKGHIELVDIADQPMLTLALDKSAFPRYLIQCCVDAGFSRRSSRRRRAADLAGDGRCRPGVALMPRHQPDRWPGVIFPLIKTDPPSANLYIAHHQDDAPVVRAHLLLLTLRRGMKTATRFRQI
jgi:DNA-binding transcriptional LysR family regulator